MSRLFLSGLILSATALSPVSAPAQEGFSGVVTFDLRASGQSSTMRYLTRDGKIRQEVEMPGMPGPMFMLLGVTPGKMQMVAPSMGMYMEIDMTASAGDGAAATGKAPVMKKLGSETIAGVSCDNYLVGDNQDMEVCVASGLGWFMNGSRPSGPMPGAGPSTPDLSIYRSAFKDGMFPLRVTQITSGKREVILEATAIDRTSVPEASLFTIPAGLRKMQMPGMGG